MVRLWQYIKHYGKRFSKRVNSFFKRHFVLISVMNTLVGIGFGYLHYQLVFNNCDLLYWSERMIIWEAWLMSYMIFKEFLYKATIVSCAIFLPLSAVMQHFNWYPYNRGRAGAPVQNVPHLRYAYEFLQARQRFGKFIFYRLVIRIDEVLKRHDLYRERNHDENEIDLELAAKWLQAREEIMHAYGQFRINAYDYLNPGETPGDRAPLEEIIYYVDEREERKLQKSPLYKKDQQIDDQIIIVLTHAVQNPKGD